MKKLSTVLLLVFCLAACGQPQPLAAASETETKTAYLSATPTLRPTRTPGPTRTRLPTLSPNPTRTAEHLTREETQTAIATVYSPFSTYCDLEAFGAYISPDKNWDYCNTGGGVSLYKRDGSRWTFSFYDHFGENLNFSPLAPSLWTSNGKFIYFPIGHPRPEGPSSLTVEDLPILAMFRMDLSTGKVDAILPVTIDYFPWYGFSFSPDEQWLAWSEASQPGLVKIRDLMKDDEFSIHFDRQFSVSEWEKSAFSWSPDSQRLTIRLLGKYGYSMAEFNVIIRSKPVISPATPYSTIIPQPATVTP
jgi:hypothetical protein